MEWDRIGPSHSPISGSFLPSQSDCFRTTGSETANKSGNLAETMMSPTFIFRWADVRPLQ